MPGAWEIIELQRRRVLLATISPADAKVTKFWARRVAMMQMPPGSAILDPGGMPYHAARNLALKTAYDGGFGYLFFLDDDVIPPADMVLRLIEASRDFIGGLYFRRYPPYDPASGIGVIEKGKEQDERAVRTILPPHNPGDIIPIDFLASGSTLLSRQCIETLLKAFPRPYDWGVDIAAVPDGFGGELPKFSEDFILSYRAKELGFQPWLHTGIICPHIMTGVATNKGLEWLAM